MPANISIGTFVTGFRDAFSDSAVAVPCDSTIEAKITLPANVAAQTGQLTTRTNNDEGVITLSTGHGIVSGTVDIYWAAGRRFGVTASREGNAITISGGTGDNLPSHETEGMTVVQQVEANINFDGDDMKVIAVVYRNIADDDAKAHIDFQDAGDESIHDIDLTPETTSGGLVRTQNIFNITGGDTNEFEGNRVTQVFATHASLSAGEIYVKLGYDA